MSARFETSEGTKVLICVNNEWKEELSNTTYNNGMLLWQIVYFNRCVHIIAI